MAFSSGFSKMASIFTLIFGLLVCLGAASPTEVLAPIVTEDSVGGRMRTRKRDETGSTAGKATLYNACPFTVYSTIVHGTGAGDTGALEEVYQTLEPEESVSHSFEHDAEVGVSWKIWREDTDNTSPVQFEYTWIQGSKRTWYDLSMIDAGEAEWLEDSDEEIVADEGGYEDYTGDIAIKYSFQEYGMTLIPQVDGKEVADGNCLSVKCAADEEFCTAAYNTSDDWGQQHDCEDSVDLKLVLCG
ncbi:hypothetical protein A1O1_09102 [Capronia coronata CBS 617.96]|uniref:Uncharacterized protein n=1 Tax=Capronia coronata CBS 617.96 TaxID=1182541 RepID=W9XMY9_9EURO|nr:uncharacterized protein A1O1_09102 [Capronia coronata CBS 617.96]EXJ78700.1 hypothetical protein A1O1_09102 [Capronia coronata CBS 617.96]